MVQDDFEIKRLNNPTVTEFIETTRSFKVPALISGLVSQWPAAGLWNTAYFKSKIGKLPVSVMVSEGGFFAGDPYLGFSQMYDRMPFDRFLDIIEGASIDEKRYYLSQCSMTLSAFSVLSQDVVRPTLIPHEVDCIQNIWLGPPDTITPLHHDSKHNLFSQILGEKRFTIFSPDQTQYLYSYPKDSKIPHCSQVNLNRPDMVAFPEFAKAKAITLVIRPTEMLFLPMHWWHQVHSLTQSISVNFWWEDLIAA